MPSASARAVRTDTVNIVFTIVGYIVIDDEVYVFYINSARKYIRGY